MINYNVYVYGCVEDVFKETTFWYDSKEDDFDAKHSNIFICELAGKIIDNLSKNGFVDVDITYDNLDCHEFQDYTIEFYTNDNYCGFMQITVCFD